MTQASIDDNLEISRVRIKLVDPTGRAIGKLKFQVKQGKRTVLQGETDQEGRIKEFSSRTGAPLSINVERFTTKDMKCIRELTPWTEIFSVVLVSGKIKEKMTLEPDKGAAGSYRRKTHTVRAGDTLGAIARSNGTTAREIASLNNMGVEATIHPGQVLKLPAAEQAGTESTTAPSAAKTKTPPRKETPAPAKTAAGAGKDQTPNAAETQTAPSRGENGSPKTTANLSCPGACIKLGDKGTLVEELNIRLIGFGGTVSASIPLDVFTNRTKAAVMQFQKDYMGTLPTGNVCGPTLAALDAFLIQFPIDLATMKCRCNRCSGFGHEFTDSSGAKIFLDKERRKPIPGTEYPGIHRTLPWALRAAIFYTESTRKCPGYRFLKISSGYRCWHDNALHSRTTTNHMGNALDIQFSKIEATTRCAGNDIEAIRSRIFIKCIGAQLGWSDDNKLSLESAKEGATSWVHVDVRQFEKQHKASRYYAVNQSSADGDPMLEIAQRENRLALLCCGGIGTATSASSPAHAASGSSIETRLEISTLSVSQKGIDFIKGWEQCKLQAYNDSRGYCTIGWGRLIAPQKCETIEQSDNAEKHNFNITQSDADKFLFEDIIKTQNIIKSRVQVPLFQHEYDALASLIFNTGSFKKCPILLSKLNTGDYSGCCDEFADITNNGTPGLIARRNREMKLFRNNSYDTTH